MIKRVLSLLMALCITLTLLPAGAVRAAAADRPDRQIRYSQPQRLVNPEYADLPEISVFSIPAPRSSGIAVAAEEDAYVTETEGARIIKKGMMDRKSTIDLHFKTTKDVRTALMDMLDVVFRHTGVPTEGDYLNRHYGGLTYEYASYDQNNVTYVTLHLYDIIYFSTAAQEASLDKKVAELLEQLNLDSSSDFHKVRKVYDYICANVSYDNRHLEDSGYTLKYSAYAALVKKTAVCQGYASLFYRLMLELGVDCRYISGYTGSINHGWNIVKIGSKYYNLDATWDEGTTFSRHSWFLLSNASFTGHTRRPEYNTPAFNKAYPMSTKNYLPRSYSLPKITKQPVSTHAFKGETAKVYVTVSAEEPTYQWYVYSSSSGTYKKSSATGRSYSFKMTEAKSGRKVYCIITDKYGAQVKTKTVTLSMATPVKITKQPSSVKVPIGDTAKVSVSATGDGLSYQWYVKNAGSSKYSKSSITGPTYKVKMTAKVSGRKVYCVITDKYGEKVKTKTVSLSKKDSLAITEQPTSVKVSRGKTAKVTVVATGEGLKYQWYVKNPGSSKYSKSSITGPTYKVKMTAKISGRKVYCVISDKYGNKVKSEVAALRVK